MLGARRVDYVPCIHEFTIACDSAHIPACPTGSIIFDYGACTAYFEICQSSSSRVDWAANIAHMGRVVTSFGRPACGLAGRPQDVTNVD
jgi:hypothetical protein